MFMLKIQLNFSNKYVSVLSSAKYHFEIIKWFLKKKISTLQNNVCDRMEMYQNAWVTINT